MSVIFDLLGSSVIIGILILSIMGININMSTETTKSLSEYHIQSEVIQLARILENDLYRMGYDVPVAPGQHKIIYADTSRIRFRTNLWNTPGSKDSVEYILGDTVSGSINPRDRVLSRFENTGLVLINYSITRFRLSYLNQRDELMTTPVTGAYLDSISGVHIYLTLESPDPLGEDIGTQYAYGFYQKLIYPRNL